MYLALPCALYTCRIDFDFLRLDIALHCFASQLYPLVLCLISRVCFLYWRWTVAFPMLHMSREKQANG